jgi:hypothetical protein
VNPEIGYVQPAGRSSSINGVVSSKSAEIIDQTGRCPSAGTYRKYAGGRRTIDAALSRDSLPGSNPIRLRHRSPPGG